MAQPLGVLQQRLAAFESKSERAPLVPTRCRPSLNVVEAMEYEEILTDFERAMQEADSDKVRELLPQLQKMSEQLQRQPGLAAYLERGRFNGAARERLRKEYISRYVLMRGGGPMYQGQGGDYTQLGAPGEATPFAQDDAMAKFKDTSVRHGFIRKVYGILAVQLLVTTLIGGMTMSVLQDVSPVVRTLCFFFSLVVLITVMCICACQPQMMRNYPINYILLFALTVGESFLVGFIGAQYTAESVLIVAGVTAMVVLGLTLFAMQTTYDFTGWGPYFFVALLVLVGVSFMFMMAAMLGQADTEAFKILRLIFAACGAMLFSCYIVYDTQLIVGGKHKLSFEVDDYCMAAISLYIDIMQLFLYMLELFGSRK